jgi:hypothetical protein
LSLNTVTLTWTAQDISAAAIGGSVSFVSNQFLTDPVDGGFIGQIQKSYPFLRGQSGTANVIANDNANIAQTGWWYIVTINLADGTNYSFNTFVNFASGANQKLAALVPLLNPAAMSGYFQLPTGTPTAGQVPVATGAGEASAWGATLVHRPATLVIAAANASTSWKNGADYVCTGTSDNAAVNAALAALPVQGGTVLLSDGTFGQSGPFIPTVNDSRVLGQGPQATLVQAAVGANCNGYQYNSASQLYNLIFCGIEGVTFNGNYNAGTGNTSGSGCRVDYSLASHTFWDFYLRDVWFNNWANDGFYSTAGHGYVLDHVLGEYCGGNGVNIAGGAFNDSPPRIVNGTFKINGLAGVTIGATNGQSVTDAVVMGNEITSNSGPYGLILSGSGQKAIGNKIGNNHGTGVYITGGNEGVELIGNTVSFNATHGLLLDDANCTVDGNFFLSNSYAATGGTTGAADEINVAHGTYSAAGNYLTGNVLDCASSSRYGINLATASDTGCVLTANRIINPVTAPTNIVPTDTIVIAPGSLALGGTKGTGIANGSAASDIAAFGQIPLVEGTIGNIKPTGTAAALGASGKWPDSDHVHAQDFGGLFGDGSDGSATLDGTATVTWAGKVSSVYTMSRDCYMTSLTVNTGVTLVTNGWRIFVQGTLSGAGTISCNGGNAAGAAAGASPVSSANCALAGNIGAVGGTGAGAQGAFTGLYGATGGAGAGGTGNGGGNAGGGARGARAGITTGIYRPPAGMLASSYGFANTIQQIGGPPGGGAGGGDGVNSGGGGGGGAGAIAIFAWAVTGTLVLSAIGGNGGTPPTGNCGAGSAGPGGLIVAYTLAAWAVASTSVLAGTAGTPVGNGGAAGASTAGNVLNVVVQ